MKSCLLRIHRFIAQFNWKAFKVHNYTFLDRFSFINIYNIFVLKNQKWSYPNSIICWIFFSFYLFLRNPTAKLFNKKYNRTVNLYKAFFNSGLMICYIAFCLVCFDLIWFDSGIYIIKNRLEAITQKCSGERGISKSQLRISKV